MEPPQGRVWGRSAEGGPASEGANSQTEGGPWRGVHPGSLPVAMGVTSSPKGQQSTGASAGPRAPSRGPCARHPSGLVPPVPPSLQPSANMSRARTPGPLLLLPRPPGRSSPGFTLCSHPREASPAGVSLPAPRPALLHTPQRRRGRWRLLPARGTHSSAPGGRGRCWLAPRCIPVSARKRRLAGVCRMEGIGIRVQSVWLSPPSHFKDEKPHVIVEKNQCGSSAGGVQGGVGTSRACEMQMQPERPRPAKELPRPQGRKGGGSLARGPAGRRDGQMMSVQCYPGPLRARGAPVLGPGAAAV